MTTASVLAMPNYTLPFTLEVDASGYEIEAVLTQQGRPIAYLSKGLSGRHKRLSTHEKEFLAILMAISKWKHYISPKSFIIKIDHQNLKYLLEQKITTVIQQKRMLKLLGLDYSIQYKKGKKKLAADASSKLELEEGSIKAITTVMPT